MDASFWCCLESINSEISSEYIVKNASFKFSLNLKKLLDVAILNTNP